MFDPCGCRLLLGDSRLDTGLKKVRCTIHDRSSSILVICRHKQDAERSRITTHPRLKKILWHASTSCSTNLTKCLEYSWHFTEHGSMSVLGFKETSWLAICAWAAVLLTYKRRECYASHVETLSDFYSSKLHMFRSLKNLKPVVKLTLHVPKPLAHARFSVPCHKPALSALVATQIIRIPVGIDLRLRKWAQRPSHRLSFPTGGGDQYIWHLMVLDPFY